MKKILRIFLILFGFFALLFGLYLYDLHALAVSGNNIFEKRCTTVNPPLIGYKNSFLKFADAINNPDKYSEDEGRVFLDGYIAGMRQYVVEENKWLELMKQHMNRLDFRLIEPWYLKQACEYQIKMYEAYRDDAKFLLDINDGKVTPEQVKSSEVRKRLNEYIKQYFDFFDEASSFRDWRKFFGRLPVPKGCNDGNLIIPDTSGAINVEGESPLPYPLPINLENGPIS